MTKETILTIKRHLKGALSAIEKYELEKKEAEEQIKGTKAP